MSVLLLLDDSDCVEENGVGKSFPLAGYAARHWVTHAQFESVSSFLRKAMECLFDLDMPYFVAWLLLHDIDTSPDSVSSSLYLFVADEKDGAIPLYYAALCGFEDLVEHLAVKYPQHVNTGGGYYVTPLFAALAGRHFQIAKLLLHNGAYVDVRGENGSTPLDSAAWYGDLEMVQLLLEYKADVNSRDDNGWTPMITVSQGYDFKATLHNIPQLFPDVARLLLEHGADVNARNKDGSTPLHEAAKEGRVEVVRVLLEHGANVGTEDNEGRTPFRIASAGGYDEIMKLLSEHEGLL
jgi:ankyrin repeat protein